MSTQALVPDSVQTFCLRKFHLYVCLGFYAISRVFQLLNGYSPQIHVSWTTIFFFFNQYFPKQALVFTCLQYSLLKTLCEKEKLLVTSNLSFSHNVFCPFERLPAIFINSEIAICEIIRFGSV